MVTDLASARSSSSCSSHSSTPPDTPLLRPRIPPRTDWALAAFQTENSIHILIEALKYYDRQENTRLQLESLMRGRTVSGVENDGSTTSVPYRVLPAGRLYRRNGSESTLILGEESDEVRQARATHSHELVRQGGIDGESASEVTQHRRSTDSYRPPTVGFLPPPDPTQDTDVTWMSNREQPDQPIVEKGRLSTEVKEVVVQDGAEEGKNDTETITQGEVEKLTSKQKKRNKQRAQKKQKKADGPKKPNAGPSTASQGGKEGETEVESIVGQQEAFNPREEEEKDYVRIEKSSPDVEAEAGGLSLSVTDFSTPELVERVEEPISPEYIEIETEKGVTQLILEERSAPHPEVSMSPPESIRTETTFVLGDDDERSAIVAVPPRLTPTEAQSEQPAAPVIVLPPVRPSVSDSMSSLEFKTRIRSPPFAPKTPRESAGEDLSRTVEVPTFSPNLQTSSPQEPSLVTPQILQFGSIVLSEEDGMSRKPARHIPLSRQVSTTSSYHPRSPLAVVPPITPATLGFPASLESTRQNTPVSDFGRPRTQSQSIGLGLGLEETQPIDGVLMPTEVNRQDPSSLESVKLNHSFTLYTTNQVNNSPQATGRYPPGLSAATSADTYSSELAPIFTAHTFGDFFGSWKALRRQISKLYSREIEEEGSSCMIPGTEGLGVYLSPKDKTLQFFRAGVKPMWEDPMCLKGGKIMLTGRGAEIDQMFFKLVLSVVAGWLDFESEGSDAMVVGVVQSSREKHSRLELWLGGSQPPPPDWVKRVETFLKTDIPGPWFAYKSFRKV